MMVRIGMVQMNVKYHCLKENMIHAEEMIKQAKEMGAELCVLPECMDIGWGTPFASQYASRIPGEVSDVLCEFAKKYRIWVASGLTERDGNAVYNSAILISEQGRIVSKHRKINIVTDVEKMYAVGDCLSLVDTPFGKIALSICADNLIESSCIGHSLGRMGVQLMLTPCSWAVAPENYGREYGDEWHETYRELSDSYNMAIVGVSNVGEVTFGDWKGYKAIGNSIAYDSDGTCLISLPYGEEAECVKIVDVSIRECQLRGTELAEHLYKRRV